jgi:hypothetical protein
MWVIGALGKSLRKLQKELQCKVNMKGYPPRSEQKYIEIVISAWSKENLKTATRAIQSFVQNAIPSINEKCRYRLAFHINACLLRSDGRGDLHTHPVQGISPTCRNETARAWMFVLVLLDYEYRILTDNGHRVIEAIEQECRDCIIAHRRGVDQVDYVYLESEERDSVLKALNKLERALQRVPRA